MSLREIAEQIRDDASEWTNGKAWTWRLPILLYLGYGGIRHLGDPYFSTIFGGITLGIHELGHVLFGFLGEWLMVAGGSICQLAAPIAAAFVLLRQRDWFGVVACAAWLSFSLWNLATYVGDARLQELPLVGLTDDPQHDWAYLLGSLGLLEADGALAFLTRALAFVIWAAAMFSGGWLLWRMHRGAR